MTLAQTAAPEIDRLVIAARRGVAPVHGERIRSIAGDLGVESLGLASMLGDFMQAGALSRSLARHRGVYWNTEAVDAELEDLLARGLLTDDGTVLAATESFRPLLAEMAAAVDDIAGRLWSGYDEHVDAAVGFAMRVAEAADADHDVAVAHRGLPGPADRFGLLVHRLTTLRYVRQHDHVEAWRGAGLTAPEIVVMTALWLGDEPSDSDEAMSALSAKGLVDEVGALTAAGREMRSAIEAETDARAQVTFDILSESDGRSFLDALNELPS